MNKDNTVPPLSYDPPNAIEYPSPSSWQNALSTILSRTETHASIILFQNEKYLCIYDKYPKAKYHCLLMPRNGILQVSGINELTLHHLDELKEFHTLARNIASKLQSSTKSTFQLGYHAIPSLTPLHLHIVSTDFHSACIKTRRHIHSFTSSFFVTVEALEEHLESSFVTISNSHNALFVDVRKNLAESLLVAPMKCRKCHRLAVNVPDWKRHNEICTAKLEKSNKVLNVLLGWSRREFFGAHWNTNFVRESSNIGFPIFTPLKDLGYYGLNPELPYKPLSSVDREDILQYLNVNGKPNQLRPVLGQKVEFENPNAATEQCCWESYQLELRCFNSNSNVIEKTARTDGNLRTLHKVHNYTNYKCMANVKGTLSCLWPQNIEDLGMH